MRSLYALGGDTRSHAQLFEAQGAISAAVQVNFFMVHRLEPQRAKRQVFNRLQQLRAVFEQKIFVPSVEICQHFGVPSVGLAAWLDRAHVCFQLEVRRAYHFFQEMAQRVGCCLPVELAVPDKGLSHGPPDKISFARLSAAN